MKKLILALLTTLFVSAMPLQAAYALADDANGSTDKQTQQACQTKEAAFTPENRQQVLDQKGDIIELEGIRASAFQARVEALKGDEAPFKADYILAVKPDGDDSTTYNTGFFVNGCFKAMLQIPAAIMEQLLAPKVPLGERVD